MRYISSYNKFNLLIESKELSRDEKIGTLLHLYSGIPVAKEKAKVVISKIIKGSRPEGFFNLYDTRKAIMPWKRLHDKMRFADYFDSLLSSKDIRGHNFEGLVAGLFGGELTNRGERADVVIDGKRWSVKFINGSSESPVLGSIKSNLSDSLVELIEGEYGSVYNLFKSSDMVNKRKVFNVAFNGIDGFIIAYPNSIIPSECTEIHLHIIKKKDMCSIVCNGGVNRPKSSGDNWSLRLSTSYKMDDPMVITVPKISDKEIDELLGEPNRKWADMVFGKKISRRIRPDVIDDIMINSDEISNRLNRFKIE